MKNVIFLLSCCVLLWTCESCKKTEDPVTPPSPSPVDLLPETHDVDALSVFACLVNGEVWKPSWGFNTLTYSYHEPTGGLSIGAENHSNNNSVVIGFSVNFLDTGVYLLKHPVYLDLNFCIAGYELDTLSSYQTEIEYFSKDEGVIIGTFEFTAINNECTDNIDTVRITEGRFKATYK